MDAQAYLLRHGWRGTGHSLDTNNTGLKKPLLVSKKIDVLGIGINKHDVVADQWWMKAFDSSLKDFGTGKQSLLGNVKEHGIKRGGLYGRFVQGEGVPGTYGRKIMEDDVGRVVVAGVESKKRKADDEEGAVVEKKKKSKKDKKAKKSGALEDSAASTPAVTDTEGGSKKKSKKSKEAKTLEGLDADKRKEYEERAKEKGLSLEEYFVKRLAKNAAARKG